MNGSKSAVLKAVAAPDVRAPSRGSLGQFLLRSIARTPIACRRRILRDAFWMFGPVLLGAPPPGIVTACSRTLCLSRKDSVKFLRRSLMYDLLFQIEWLALAYRSKRGLLSDTRHLSVDRPAEWTWLTQQKGAILGTMHFGPYSLGLVWLFHHYFAGRTVVIMKTRTNDVHERAAISRLSELGVDLRFASPDSVEESFELVKLVRRGAFAIVMVDLPHGYGRSSVAGTLGHELCFADGAIDLAALCQVPLVLFTTRSDITADRIEVAEICEVRRNNEPSRERAVKKVHRFIADNLSAWPEQWHMWTRFNEYQRRG